MELSACKEESFKRRLMKKFLYDATLCALKRSSRCDGKLPMLRIEDDENLMIERHLPLGIDTEIAGSPRIKGLFAHLKKAKTVRRSKEKQRRTSNQIRLFTERDLFSTIIPIETDMVDDDAPRSAVHGLSPRALSVKDNTVSSPITCHMGAVSQVCAPIIETDCQDLGSTDDASVCIETLSIEGSDYYYGD